MSYFSYCKDALKLDYVRKTKALCVKPTLKNNHLPLESICRSEHLTSYSSGQSTYSVIFYMDTNYFGSNSHLCKFNGAFTYGKNKLGKHIKDNKHSYTIYFVHKYFNYLYRRNMFDKPIKFH